MFRLVIAQYLNTVMLDTFAINIVSTNFIKLNTLNILLSSANHSYASRLSPIHSLPLNIK